MVTQKIKMKYAIFLAFALVSLVSFTLNDLFVLPIPTCWYLEAHISFLHWHQLGIAMALHWVKQMMLGSRWGLQCNRPTCPNVTPNHGRI